MQQKSAFLFFWIHSALWDVTDADRLEVMRMLQRDNPVEYKAISESSYGKRAQTRRSPGRGKWEYEETLLEH